MPGEWTVVRIHGNRGLPALDGGEFLGCIASVRGELAETRWHHRWVPDSSGQARDGLRVELPYGSAEMKRLLKALEDRIPPPDTVDCEPLRKQVDLDNVQSEEELEVCLEVLWRYSEFISDLWARNPALTATSIRDLTPGAFLSFVTGDRRHLERAMDEQAVANVPAVAFGRAMGLIREARLKYHIPPSNRDEASAAARIHHLAGCTFASRYYPFRQTV
ncbi:MAG: hypothetical protein Q8W46_09155 [Candidatus Palauibacterales bacterium]|nr:hypothetical protein [Candidatus Palauibacterales bacterium]